MARLTPARVLSVGLLALGVLAFANSRNWRGASFPGFFLMPNRVVPSVSLPDWSGVREGRPLHQQLLVAVDDVPVVTPEQAYARAGAHAPGEVVRYTFARGGMLESRTFALRTFTTREHRLIFGTYFASGVLYLLLAVLAAECWEHGVLYRGLAAYGWASAAFAFTAIDLYGPGTMFRLHALAEACLPAALAHLALVCPRDRAARWPAALLLSYVVPLALAVVYQLVLYDPTAYSVLHHAAETLALVPLTALLIFHCMELSSARPEPALGRTRLLFAGVVTGIGVPGAVLVVSGLSGGSVPVNIAAWLAFTFPLAAIAALPALLPSSALVHRTA
jgi:hypothetical protein